MEDVLTTVRALIALAASPTTPEAEARTAAVSACKFIKSKNLILSLPASNFGSTFPAPDPPRAPKSKSRAVPGGWRRMKSKYGGTCKRCSKPISKDAYIYWCRNNGALHEACFKAKNTQ